MLNTLFSEHSSFCYRNSKIRTLHINETQIYDKWALLVIIVSMLAIRHVHSCIDHNNVHSHILYIRRI